MPHQQRGTELLPFLDGLRGYASLWVLMSHALILSGTKIPLLIEGGLAVDVFMIMSGFLMTFHYYRRVQKEPWESPETWRNFWLRRFFRIAPLYYLLLAVGLGISSYLGTCRQEISEAFPGSGTDPIRYQDTSLANLFMHVSFLFGLLPRYAFSTPLPDWSIGLEAQFYLAFPFIMLLLKHWSFVWTTVVFFILNLAAIRFLPTFPMPSLLLLKLNFFLIGILLASAIPEGEKRARNRLILLSLVICLAVLGNDQFKHSVFILGIVSLIASILFYDRERDPFRIAKLVSISEKALSGKLAGFLAETSYSVYLLHLLIMLPIGAILSHLDFYLRLPGLLRFSILTFLVALPTYGIAICLFRWIEMPGNSLGRKLVVQATKFTS